MREQRMMVMVRFMMMMMMMMMIMMMITIMMTIMIRLVMVLDNFVARKNDRSVRIGTCNV